MEVLDNINEHLNKREYIIGIYLDLQKAFDTVKCCIVENKPSLSFSVVDACLTDFVVLYSN